MKPAQFRDMLKVFFWGGEGVKRVCMSNIFFKYCIGQKMGYFYFGLLTGVFFLFY